MAPGEANAAPEPAAPSSSDQPEAQNRNAQLSRDDICQMIESAANGEALPFEFLARLIWQESKFNPQAVSPAGAQGIAQFMPKVASGRGLTNPFEPAAALQESAEFLRELRDRFGNLGLAAAAYNAGPKRVQDWLHRRSTLPRETQNYVHIITGYRPETWINSAPPVETTVFTSDQCNEIAKLAAQRRSMAAMERFASVLSQRMAQRSRTAASAPRGSARSKVLGKRGVQVAGTRIEQVTKVVAQAGKPPRVERIIKIMAVAAQPKAGKNVRVVQAPAKNANPNPRGVRLVASLAKSKAVPAPVEKKAVLAQNHAKGAVAGGKTHVATNASASCTHKGSHKVCRAA